MQTRTRHLLTPLALAGLLTLGACGGGGGGGGASSPPPAPTPLTVSGTAATGAPIANAPTEIKCAGGGTATTTTSATGGYTATVLNGTLPCVIRVTANGQSIHSVIEAGVALPAVANVTPLTDLLTSQIAQGTATGFFDNFDATAQARLTPAAVTQATTQVVSALAGIVSLQGDDLLRGTLVPATDGEGGNLADQKLDALARALREAGTSISAVAQALVTAPGTPPPVLAGVPLAAATCPALRSGEYWHLEPIDPDLIAIVRFDAATMEAIYDFGQAPLTTVTYRPVANEPCRFTITDNPQVAGTEDLVVSSSGIAASRFPEGGGFKGSILFPKQDIALSELAGNWNSVGYVLETAGVVVPENGSLSIAANGAVTVGDTFIGLVDDGGSENPSQLSLRSDGSFDEVITTPNGLVNSRWFAHRAPNGAMTVFIPGLEPGQPGFGVLRKQEFAALRPVGSVANFWDLEYSAGGVSAIADLSRTITAIDTTAGTETRIAAENNRVDTRRFNFPRTGMIYRAANSCTNGVGGAPVNCPESIVLAGQGTGFVPIVRGTGTNAVLEISISKP